MSGSAALGDSDVEWSVKGGGVANFKIAQGAAEFESPKSAVLIFNSL